MSVSDAFPNPVAMRRDVLLGGGGAAANPPRTAFATDTERLGLPGLTTGHKDPQR